MENQRRPNNPKFQEKQDMLRHRLKKVNDPIELLWPRQSKGVQRQMLNQVKPSWNHSGQRMQLVPKKAFAARHIFSSHHTHATVPLT
jgi:hypothetical protein